MIDPREVVRNIPIATDRLLIQLGNDLNETRHHLDFRASEGFFARLKNRLTGRDRKRRDLIEERVHSGQAKTVEWMKELAARHQATNLALMEFGNALVEIQEEIVAGYAATELTRAEVRELAGIVSDLIGSVSARLDHHEWRLDEHEARLDFHGYKIDKLEQSLSELDRRVLRTELWQAGWADFEDALRRWEAQGAYANLPFPAQATLLAREVASSGAGLHAYATGDNSYQHRLEDRIISGARGAWTGARSLERILNETASGMPSDDHRLMVAEILGLGVEPDDGIPRTPLAWAMATTLDLAVHPVNRGGNPGGQALRTAGHILSSPTATEFVRLAVAEQSQAVATRRRQLQEERRQHESAR